MNEYTQCVDFRFRIVGLSDGEFLVYVDFLNVNGDVEISHTGYALVAEWLHDKKGVR